MAANPLLYLLDPDKRQALEAAGSGAAAPIVLPEVQVQAEPQTSDADQFRASLKQDQPEPELAPAPAPEETSLEDMRRNLIQKGYEGVMNPNEAPTGPGGQKTRKPTWFEYMAPPKQKAGVGLFSNLLGGLAQAAQNRAAVAASNPLTPMATKYETANQAGLAGGLMGGFQGMLNKPQTDFQNEQDAALKQAQEYRALNPTTRGAAGGEAMSVLRAIQGDTRLQEEMEKEKLKRELTRRMKDKNSPESRDMQATAVRAGLLTPEEARNYSAFQLEKHGMTALMQRSQQVERGNEFDRQFAARQAERLGEKEAEQVVKVEQEKRAEKQRQLEGQIPGLVSLAGTPPPPAVQAQARQIQTDRQQMVQDATRLKEIQEELEKAGPLAAAAGQTIEKYLGSEETKSLLAEAKQRHQNMVDAQRRMKQFGVPQQYELELLNGLNPTPGTLNSLFTGKANWDAIAQSTEQNAKRALRNAGYGIEGEDVPAQNPIMAPSEGQIHRFNKPQTKKYASDEPLVGETTAAPAKDGAVGIYDIELPSGKKGRSALTQEELENLQNNILRAGKGSVTRVQQ